MTRTTVQDRIKAPCQQQAAEAGFDPSSMTTAQVAWLLHVSQAYVTSVCKSELLKSRWVGPLRVVDHADLDAFLSRTIKFGPRTGKDGKALKKYRARGEASTA